MRWMLRKLRISSPAPSKQDDRQRELGDDQGLSQTYRPPTRSARPRVGLERIVRIGARGLHGRQHADQQTAHQRERQAPRRAR